MLSSLTTLSLREATQVVAPAVVVPVITPTPPPVAPPLSSAPLPPDPAIAPPPVYQFRGEGGTPFGSVPQLYTQRPVIAESRCGTGGFRCGEVGYNPPPPVAYDPDAPPPPIIHIGLRPGDHTIQPVPSDPPPAKPPVPKPVDPVTQPAPAGPVRGMVLGFDLSKVPLWAWIGLVAVVGVRVLR